MKRITVVLAVLMVVGTASVWAKECAINNWVKDKASSDSYPTKFVGLLGDGVYRVVETPFIVLKHPYNDLVTDKDYATGLFTGVVKGLYHGIENVDAAAANILSAPIPGFNGMKTDHEKTTDTAAA